MLFLYRIFLVILLPGFLLATLTLTMMLNWNTSAFNAVALTGFLLWLGSWKQKHFAWVLLVFCTSVAAFFTVITPEEQFKNTKWEDSCARMPQIIIDGNHAVIHDLRDFKYRSEHNYDVNYINAEYDLDKLDSLDLIMSHWDGMDNVAHTLLCFNFSDGKTAVLSVEMRCPDGISRAYPTTFFKQASRWSHSLVARSCRR